MKVATTKDVEGKANCHRAEEQVEWSLPTRCSLLIPLGIIGLCFTMRLVRVYKDEGDHGM